MEENVQKDESQNVTGKRIRVRGTGARQPIPSSGIAFEGQLKLLRAYVNASEGGEKAVSLDRLAGLTRISKFSISSCNNFFHASNFINRERNGYKPSEGLLSFVKQLPWNEEKAKGYLRDMMADAWYKKEIDILFSTNATMDTSDLISSLGSIVGARPDQKTSLELLVKFLVYTEMISVDPNTGNLTYGMEDKPQEPGIITQQQTITPMTPQIEVGRTTTPLTINLNLTLDITEGETKDHVKKIKEVLEGLNESHTSPNMEE